MASTLLLRRRRKKKKKKEKKRFLFKFNLVPVRVGNEAIGLDLT